MPWSRGAFSSRAGSVQVVDFGCGALAVQFAVALAAADTLKSGKRLDLIRVDSFDTSAAMMKMGARVWLHFRATLEELHPGDPLTEIVGSMDVKLHRSVKSIERIDGASQLLTAIHAVYDANKEPVQKDLRRLGRRLRPNGCLLTTYSGYWQLLDDVSPLRGAPGYVERTTGFPNPIRVQSQFDGTVKEVFEWRKTLWRSLNLPLGAEGINYWFIKNMLNQPVSWEYRSPAIQAYLKSS